MHNIKRFIKKILPAKWIEPAIVLRNKFLSMGKIGGDFLCPCCGTDLKSFSDWQPDKKRNNLEWIVEEKNIYCPVCNSLPRHRLICDILNQRFSDHDLQEKRILVFAPEFSIKTYLNQRGVKYETADLFRKDVDHQIDISQTGFSDESFDIIFCNHVLEHVVDDSKAMRELRRILKNNGVLIVTTPLDKKLSKTIEDISETDEAVMVKKFGQHDHFRMYGVDFSCRLKEAGFLVEEISGEGSDFRKRILTGPMKYDIDVVFWCRR